MVTVFFERPLWLFTRVLEGCLPTTICWDVLRSVCLGRRPETLTAVVFVAKKGVQERRPES